MDEIGRNWTNWTNWTDEVLEELQLLSQKILIIQFQFFQLARATFVNFNSVFLEVPEANARKAIKTDYFFIEKSVCAKILLMKAKKRSTSWEPVHTWYQKSVGEEGHYYHQHVVIPGTLKLLELKNSNSYSLLDLACGNGILAHHIPKEVSYLGVDISPSLLKSAKLTDKNFHHKYLIGDVTKQLTFEKNDFSHVAIILAIQNMKDPQSVFKNAAKHLIEGGRLVLVMNHPCFRIPRQSSWKVDEEQKIQFRRIDRYSSPLQIPIQAHPSKGEKSEATWSFHYPLSTYTTWLYEAGFKIELIEEWHSNKISTGRAAKMENRSRAEIPLFMAIRAIKLPFVC